MKGEIKYGGFGFWRENFKDFRDFWDFGGFIRVILFIRLLKKAIKYAPLI
jgi:hypothetical protein